MTSSWVCVMLGESCRCAQRDWLLLMLEYQSRLSELADSFLFRKRLRPSWPPVRTGGAEDSSGWRRAVTVSAPSSRRPFHATPDPEWTRSSSVPWQRLSMSSGSGGLWPRSQLDEWFLPGRHQAPRQRSSPSSPKYTMSQSYVCTRWMHLLGGWTSGFGATLYGCAPGLPGPRCSPVRRLVSMQLHSGT